MRYGLHGIELVATNNVLDDGNHGVIIDHNQNFHLLNVNPL